MKANWNDKQAIETLRASWLEPDEPSVVAVDYRGNDLYFGDEAFRTEDGLVRDEDIYEFMERKYGKVVRLEDE